MAKEKRGFSYNRNDRQSGYHCAANLRGSTLREKTEAVEIDDIRRNKGSFGSAVEVHYFTLDLNRTPLLASSQR